jgi:hypothetical protein
MADLSRIKEVYFAVSDLPAADRTALLELKCAGDQALQEAVQRLLEAGRTSAGFLSDPTFTPENANGGISATAERPAPGRVVCGGSSYEVGELLGRGGCAAVYRARQERPVERTVENVYLNGNLIAASNLDAAPNYRTPAGRAMGRVGGVLPYSFVVSSDALVSGENLIAVEVHRASGQRNSVFDLQLEALRIPYRSSE